VQIDDVEIANITTQDIRTDVYNLYPDYPNSLHSGFSVRYNFSNLSEGLHQVEVFAFLDNGDYNVVTANVNTTKYQGGWAFSNEVDLSDVVVDYYSAPLLLRGIKFKDTTHSAKLEWDQTVQNLVVKKVEIDTGFDSLDDIEGDYVLAQASVQYGDMSIIDSRQFDFSIEGSMTIGKSTITQDIILTYQGYSVPVNVSGTYINFGYYLSTNNSNMVVVNQNNGVLITSTHINAGDGTNDLNEVDVWLKANLLSTTKQTEITTTKNGTIGGSFFEAINTLGISPF
jgi:hypothetical protein